MNNRVGVFSFDKDVNIIAGTWIQNVDSGSRFNGYQWNNSAANGDEAFFTRYFTKGGLYRVRFVYLKNNNQAKADIGLDSNGSTNLFSQLDMYNASLTYNNVIEMTKEITRGFHDIHFKANGKNASSSGYNLQGFILFDLIQEYPVYQDDQPPTGLEGDEVVLYKTTLASTATSISIPLAAVDIINKYSEIEIVLDTLPSASANLTLALTAGGLSGSVCYGNAVKVLGTTVTGVSFSATATWTLADTTVITGASQEVFVRAVISGTGIGGGNYRLIWQAGSGTIGDIRGSGGASATVSGTVTNVTLALSSGNFPASTSVVIHGRKKK